MPLLQVSLRMTWQATWQPEPQCSHPQTPGDRDAVRREAWPLRLLHTCRVCPSLEPHEGMGSWPLGTAQEEGRCRYKETWDQTIHMSKLLNPAEPQLTL